MVKIRKCLAAPPQEPHLPLSALGLDFRPFGRQSTPPNSNFWLRRWQRRRKSLNSCWWRVLRGLQANGRGVGSTLTLVRQIPSSSLPSLLSTSFCPFRSSRALIFFPPPSILPLPTIFASLPLEVGALNPASGSGAEPQRKSNLVHFSMEI